MNASPLQVLLFTDADVFAGTERYVLELGKGLKRAGVHVEIACPEPAPLADGARASGIGFIRIDKRGSVDQRAVRRLVQLLREQPRRVIHCQNGRTALLATVARSIAGRGCVVLTQHFLAPSYTTRDGLKRVVSDRLHQWVDHRTDHVIAISDVVGRNVIERGEARPCDVTRVHNGISVDSGLLDRSRARGLLNVGDSTPLVICAARLESEKRVDVLIDAMRSITKQIASARCFVAGQGNEQALLAQRISDAGLDHSVQLLGFRNDVRELIAAADVFVLPAPAEPFGLVVLEAMSVGTPVIATDAGGPREIVLPGQTGWLVKPGDPVALAEAILEALSDPTRARAMGAAGRERLLSHFTADRMAAETIAVYHKALARAADRRSGRQYASEPSADGLRSEADATSQR